MARRNVVVGLDIGTTKVVALAGEVASNGKVDIIGFGEAPSMVCVKVLSLMLTIVRSIDLAIEKRTDDWLSDNRRVRRSAAPYQFPEQPRSSGYRK